MGKQEERFQGRELSEPDVLSAGGSPLTLGMEADHCEKKSQPLSCLEGLCPELGLNWGRRTSGGSELRKFTQLMMPWCRLFYLDKSLPPCRPQCLLE